MLKLFEFRKSIPRNYYFSFVSGSFTVIFSIWCILSYGGIVDTFFLPKPGTILSTIWQLFTQYGLLGDIGISVFRILSAFIIAALLAIPLGILMSSFKAIEALAEPSIDFIRYLPIPALVPLCILWVGIGEASKILLLFIGTFFQLVLLVMDDANNVPNQYLELAKTLGASKIKLLTRVIIPSSLPNIYDDLRITLGWCWTYLLIGELVAASSGLGHMIREAQRFAKPEVVISGILIIGIIGLCTDMVFKSFQKKLFPYKR